MQYEVEVGGRTRQVTVTREGAAFVVTVNGRARRVDAARIDANTLSLILDGPGSTAARVATVTVVAPDSAGELTVGVQGTPVPVVLNGRRRGRRDDGGSAAAGPQRLTAPMPGKIVRVLVKVGDSVAPRQPLVVIEAMKMENELRAGRTGTVTEVQAREGRSVDAGALLIVIQ
jgi:biotin carboxyl carrier protein